MLPALVSALSPPLPSYHSALVTIHSPKSPASAHSFRAIAISSALLLLSSFANSPALPHIPFLLWTTYTCNQAQKQFFMTVESWCSSCFCVLCVCFLCRPFRHGALKLDMSTLFTNIFSLNIFSIYIVSMWGIQKDKSEINGNISSSEFSEKFIKNDYKMLQTESKHITYNFWKVIPPTVYKN